MADAGALPVPAEEPLDQWLGSNAKKDTSIIEQLRKLLSTASGLDATLLLSNYLVLLALTGLRAYDSPIAVQAARPDPRNASSIDKESTPLKTAINNLSNLATLMVDTRLFMRLWNILGIHRWIQSMIHNPPLDAVVEGIVWSQIGLNTVYMTMEHVAFLGKREVLPLSKKTQDSLWRISRRLWNVHIILDFLRLARLKFVEAHKMKRRKGKRREDLSREEQAKQALAKAEDDERWQREFTVNSIYSVLTTHWGCKNKLLDDSWVGALGSIAGWISVSQAWKKAGQD